MAFHNIRAYFTGFNYEPDPDPQRQAEPDAGPQPIGLQSIVETIVREKVGQEPEEQSSTAEGDTTFNDLIERHEEETVAGPEPMPSVLDGIPVDAPGGSTDLPAERIVDNGPEPALGPAQDDGAAPDGPAMDAVDAPGATDTADPADRLGLDSLFGPQQEGPQDGPQQDGAQEGGMLGGPGYDDVVEEALGYGREDADEAQGEGYEAGEGLAPEDEGEALEDVEDLLPEEDEVLGEPTAVGDRGFLRSILRAPERRAAAAARRLAAVTINIGIDGEDDDVAVGLTGADGTDFDFEAEASAAARRVLASDVTINIDISGGPDEPDLEGFGDFPEAEPSAPEPEEPSGEEVVGPPMSDEELVEGLKAGPEKGRSERDKMEVKPEKGQSKQDRMEAFDELDDLGDVFKPGGGESDETGETGEIEQLGV